MPYQALNNLIDTEDNDTVNSDLALRVIRPPSDNEIEVDTGQLAVVLRPTFSVAVVREPNNDNEVSNISSSKVAGESWQRLLRDVDVTSIVEGRVGNQTYTGQGVIGL